MNRDLFSKNKKYKKIGIAIIILVTLIIFFKNVRFQSVSEYKAQQQNMVDEYSRNNEKQSGNISSSPKIEGEDLGEDSTGSAISELNLSTMDNSENVGINSDGQIIDQNNVNNSTLNSTLNGTSSNNAYDNRNTADDNSGGTISNSIKNSNTNSNTNSNDNNGTSASEPRYVTCTIEIRCDTVLNNKSKWTNKKPFNIIPSDGVILDKMTISIQEGSKVYDVLMMATKMGNITIDSEPNYIISINQLAQMDVGNLSGWMYWVNDVKPSYGCSSYKVLEGDKIKWQYTCNMGEEFDTNGHLKQE